MFMDDWSFQINVGLRPGWDICQEFQCGFCQETIDKKLWDPGVKKGQNSWANLDEK